MRWLKRVGIGAVVLVALFFGVGLLLPSEYRVERSVVIAAEPEAIHRWVGELREWPEWSPWERIDPTIATTYGEKTTGIGARQSWTGESGNGELTLTKCDPTTGVAYDLSFDDGRYRSTGAIRYEEIADGTRVSWLMEGDTGMNPIGRYFGLIMDRMVGPPFEQGLARLKQVVESSRADSEELLELPPPEPGDAEPAG